MSNEQTKHLIEDYFSGFAAAVAQSRALVSVEDGLKPSMRMAMYANYTDKWTADKKTGKFIKLIGSASRFCWHGDTSTYGMLIRAAKPFALRYPLYTAQGSYGTLMSPDSHAAARYVEGKISKIGMTLFDKLNKDVITDWRDNYDNTEKYPGLLPSIGFWNICNGTSGIGTGLASSIPQFNLVEMNEALIALLWNKPYKMPMPDFATGGILVNADEVKEALENGTGAACKLRARIIYDDKKRLFRVTELPYATYTNTICEELRELIKDPENGIEDFNDATGTHPDIEIYLTKKAKPDEVLTLLYKKTSLQNTFGINLTMLENCRYPRVYTLEEAMKAHLDHQVEMYRRGFEYDRAAAMARLNIVKGYIIAAENIEEIVDLIRNSADKNTAKASLMAKYKLNAEQAEAILKLTLAKITKLEVNKYYSEKEALENEIAYLNNILTDNQLLYKEVEKGYRKVISEFGDSRRTEILNLVSNENEKLLYFMGNGKAALTEPKNETVIATIIRGTPYLGVTRNGMVYRSNDVPKRMKSVFKLDEGDSIIGVFPDNEANFLFFLDDEGHFRCKEISTLNKIKTTLPFRRLSVVGIATERVSKTSYKPFLNGEH